jgi:hypothetical protein
LPSTAARVAARGGEAMEGMTNRRRHTRFAVPVAVELSWSGGAVTAVTDDLSAGGCRLPLAAPPPAGTLVKVWIRTEGGDLGAAGVARVAWAQPGQPAQGEAPGVLGACGLSFAPSLIEAMPPLLRRLVGAAPLDVLPAPGAGPT